LRQSQLMGEFVLGGNASARHAIVETQHPDPPAVKDVMHRGVIHRIRRLSRSPFPSMTGHIRPLLHAGKVAVEPLRPREMVKRCYGKRQTSLQKSARTAGINDESRPD